MELIDRLTNQVEKAKINSLGINEIIHVWLEGFQTLVGDKSLEKVNAENYLEETLKEFLPFTITHSASFLMHNFELINSGKRVILTLPVNNDYHLQFPLDKENGFYNFVTPICTFNSCKRCGFKKMPLPIITMKRSILMDTIYEEAGGALMINNSTHAGHLAQEEIHATYKAIYKFVEACKM